jgi:hypothetical protein
MNKSFKVLSALVLTALLAVSCVEDDASPVLNTENPFALYADSPVTVQLEALAANQLDCLEMMFPITVATYAEGFVIDQTYTFNNSTELINFINALGEGDAYAIQFPFNITGNGEELAITGNENFITTLQAEADECCISTNTAFSQLYNSVTAAEQNTMDTFTHEYTFSASQAGKICSIGYKGETDVLNYLVEIVDANNAVLYTGNHTFTSSQMSYISIPAVTINANQQYTIRRSIAGYGPGSSGIGTLKSGSAILPVTFGDITIHQANFYGGGGSGVTHDYLPMIDFVFKPQQP